MTLQRTLTARVAQTRMHEVFSTMFGGMTYNSIILRTIRYPMKNISYSQYKREMHESVGEEGETSLIDSVEVPIQSSGLVREVELLNHELHSFRIR